MKKQSPSPAAKGLLAAAACTAGIHLLSALTLDCRLQYKPVVYTSPRLDPSLDGYTIAFLTDLHDYPPYKVCEMVDRLNALHPDLALLGGDYAMRGHPPRCLPSLARLRCRDGIFAVEGNHDNAAQLRRELRSLDITPLENQGVRLRDGLYLAGLEDLRNRNPNVDRALSGARERDFVLMVCHNPDVGMVRDLSRVDLTLCGHTHGGEISLFGLWAPALALLSRYGQTYATGWCKSRSGTDLYVSNGIGRHAPMRVFARPQVILLTLRSGRAQRQSRYSPLF